MRPDITIDNNLFPVYSEIRLGLLRFQADVKKSPELVRAYMSAMLPQLKYWNKK